MIYVSIHAPWEGCDFKFHLLMSKRSVFQFTHPGKGATRKPEVTLIGSPFQFTHPGKGATRVGRRSCATARRFNSRTLGRVRRCVEVDLPAFDEVSIHAPWEGCDSIASLPAKIPARFQFTHPGKGATRLIYAIELLSHTFQFTHPGKGATHKLNNVR